MRKGSVQGYALLYGLSSKAIRIVNGEKVDVVATQHRSPKRTTEPIRVESKRYKMDEETKRRLDSLQDPLDIMSRHSRAQKYEATKSSKKYEYGLSDW